MSTTKLILLRTIVSPKRRVTGGIRPFSLGSNSSLTNRNNDGAFGLDKILNNNTHQQSAKFRSTSATTTTTPTTQSKSSSLLGGEITRRIAENRQSQLQDLRGGQEDRIKMHREERASLDQLWKNVSQLKVQSHFGPLTPASSRVIRTVRIPPTSFLNRPALASDVERSYRRLQTWLNAAGLRKEIYLNKRYEKPFLKRRRLNSERHRRRFAIEVQRRVQIINVMRMKGM